MLPLTLAAAKTAALAATSGSGHCGDTLNFAATDDGQSCPLTITVTGTDACGNQSSVQYTTKILTSGPVLSGWVSGRGRALGMGGLLFASRKNPRRVPGM